ncbi:hypothetical protein K435DRAFT_902517 [Dendrothele bispora CBS 962.96]|uniref:Uncharacterized protein n=1 Tax=Dendrothele bispora (strain CBS 962.96) TaxID=1314807 RepID=A0A4S8KLZ6_DENBC|nr:hypothetical protein K435DRAFT_902517 [Dendrothele bispora CBS 962.96]
MATAGAIIAEIITLLSKRKFASTRLQANQILYSCVADLILIFRCYVVWDYKRTVLITVTVISIGNNVTAFVAWGFTIRDDYVIHNDESVIAAWFPWIFLIMNILVNLTLSLMIAGKIWQQRVATKILGAKLQRIYRSALLITLESGILYSVTILACGLLALFVLTPLYCYCILLQMAAIAPTMITVRAGLGVNGGNDHILKEDHLMNLDKHEYLLLPSVTKSEG